MQPPPADRIEAAARPRRAAVLLAVGLALAAGIAAAGDAPAYRIVSINPSLTSIVVALGAADRLVGVDDYSAGQNAALADLPRVGGLFSPSLEAVVALRPDAVVLVPSAEQRDFRERLEGMGLRVEVFDNIRFAEVVDNVERLGAIVERDTEARSRVRAIEATRAAVSAATAARPSPRVLLVLQRDPVFLVGRGSFLDEMLEVAGATNLARELSDPYPRVAIEWVVARAPEVLIDLSPDADEPARYWARWSSIPAVTAGRVLRLDAALVSMPGPHLDRALETLAVGLYGDAIRADIERAR